ncbi:S26 family signal peptidase [Sinorhizobium saheli]|nr:S26 family signal peptidase [Sinorhizobium saheli]MQW87829.1 S26 family signal peptidase [Sinorhizobium saheli]
MAPAPGDRAVTRLGTLAATSVAVLGVAVASVTPLPLKLIWNATASAPIGFYTVAPAERVEVPDLVAVMPPEPFASFMVGRGYVGRDVPILKHVIGLPGQRLCRAGRAITVDNVPLGEARERDSRGRDLPVWQGCRVIADGELFLMNLEAADSLDGRYFGPFPAEAVIGQATPLFTDEDGDGRFVWRAPTR